MTFGRVSVASTLRQGAGRWKQRQTVRPYHRACPCATVRETSILAAIIRTRRARGSVRTDEPIPRTDSRFAPLVAPSEVKGSGRWLPPRSASRRARRRMHGLPSLAMHDDEDSMAVIDLLRSADLTYGHLEMNLADYSELAFPARGDWLGSFMMSDPQVARDLNWAGIDIMSLAHNHSMDFGEPAWPHHQAL